MKKATTSLTAAVLALALAPTPPGEARPQAAPSPAPAATQQAIPVFGVESSLVLLDVVVRDKKGNLVRDLTAADFEVMEDGRKQPVSDFTIVDRYDAIQAAAEATSPSTPATAPSGPGAQATAPARPPRPGDNRPAVIAFVFDRLSPIARDTARKAALAYTERGHVDGDLVAVFGIDLALRTLQPFTADLASVRAAFDRAGMQASAEYAGDRQTSREFAARAERFENQINSLNQGAVGGPSQNVADQAANLATEAVFANMQANMLDSFDRLERDQQGFSATNGLLALVSGLKALPGRKAIVFFSEGLSISANVLAQFRSVVASANRANVTVYAIDAGGLRTHSGTEEARNELVRTASARMREESLGGVGGMGPLTQRMERAEDMLRLDPKSGLGQLADGTGGFLVADTNDTAKGFRRIQEDMRFYYLLSYAPTNPAFDGGFRTISVKVNRPGAQIQSRKGYFAVRPDVSVPVRSFEAPAFAELDRRPLPSAFPITVAALSFPETQRPGRVPVLVELSAASLRFEPDKKTKDFHANFSVVARVRDAQGREVDRMSREYPLTVAADKLEAAKNGEVLFFQETNLGPGRYTVEAVAYDSLAKSASARTSTFEVPEIPQGTLRLSSLLILKRVEKLTAAEQGRDNPLYFGDMALYPNLGQPLKKSITPQLGFFFSAYGFPAGSPPSQAIVEILKADKVAKRTPTLLPAPDASGRIQHAVALPLASFEPGEYTLKVTIASGTSIATRKVTFVVAE